MGTRWDTAETMLASSQRVRDELVEAVSRLDSYIDLLKVELARRDGRRGETGSAGESNPPPA